MKRKTNKVPHSRRIQLGYLGLVVALWNELESQVKNVLLALPPDNNRLIASWLVADLQIGPLINATRLLSKEMQWMYDRANMTMRKRRTHQKLFETHAERVEHFLTGVDILREHRNYYVHYAINDKSDPHHQRLQISRVSARGAVHWTNHPIEETALERLAFQITDYLVYGDEIEDALKKNASNDFSVRPSWPEKPPLPEKLKTTRITLQDALHPPQSLLETDSRGPAKRPARKRQTPPKKRRKKRK